MLRLASRFFSLQDDAVNWVQREALAEAAFAPLESTIGHQVLALDNAAIPTPEAALVKLDATLEAVVSQVKIGSMPQTTDEAVAVLSQIESVLIRQNYACSIPYRVANFSEGLLPRPLNLELTRDSTNRLRRAHMLEHAGELFSIVDCDLGSLLYLSIADRLGLPLVMVEVPEHNFIRWIFDNGLPHLNWDTNYGYSVFSDEGYISHHGVPPETISQGVFLANMTRTTVLGYFNQCRGLAWQSLKEYERALAEYRLSTQANPKAPNPLNNLAWLYASSRKAQKFVAAAEAIESAEKAVNLFRHPDLLDTLGCTYAEAGDFAKALQAEKAAYQMSGNPQFLELIEAFENNRTYLDLHPEVE